MSRSSPPVADPREALCRVPPHAEDAEQALLGAVLVDDKAFPLARDIVSAESFYVESHRAIFEAMLYLAGKHVTIDGVTLAEALKDRGQFDRIGGAAYLDALIDRVPVAAHIEEHAAIIREKSVIRRLMLGCTQTTSDGFAGASLADLHRLLSGVVNDCAPASVPTDRGDGLRAALDAREGDKLYLPICGTPDTGKDRRQFDLGWILGPFDNGQKLCIAGYSNSGKTGLALALAVSCAHSGIPTGYFALEDSQGDLEARTAGVLAALSPRKIQDGRLSPVERYEAERVVSWFRARGFWTFRMIGATAEEVCNAVQAETVRHKLRAVFVDYVQAVSFLARQSEAEQIDRLVKGIERASGKYAVAVLLSQLNRKDVPQGKRPGLEHLRGSGAIGHLSQKVLIVNNEGEAGTAADDAVSVGDYPLTLDLVKNKGPMGPMVGTLFRPQAYAWPGHTRPVLRWEADDVPLPGPEEPPIDDSALLDTGYEGGR